MAFYFVTGKLGNGKTLCSVGRIRDKLRQGCTIATNINLDLVAMLGAHAKNCRVIRVPDKPTVDDLHLIGNANLTYDENQNGLLVLDECGTWFNSRNWQDKSRMAVNNWFLHARKLGWDVLLIVQDISIVDSQARDALSEHTVFCKRLDRLAIPVIGSLFKALTGSRLSLPRVHLAKVVYGMNPNDLLSDRWVYRGNDLFAVYDTKQAFMADYPHGVYSMLTPWHLKGRYRVPMTWRNRMRITKIYWKRFKSPLALFSGVGAGIALTASAAMAAIATKSAPAPAPVAHVKTVTPATIAPDKFETPAPDLMLEKIKRFRIVASVKMGAKTYYEFAQTSLGGSSGPRVSSDQLKQAGLGVVWRDECSATLIYQGTEYPVYCF